MGNLTEVTELDSTTVEYEYDALYRLTSEVRTGTNPYSRTYGYDLANNVTTINGSAFATYDAGNKLSALSGGSVAHDSYGNLRSASATGVTFTALAASPYDARNKITTGTSGRQYRYHAEGIRGALKPNTSGAWVAYLHDGPNLIGEINSSGPIAAYTHGPDGLISQRLLTGTPKSLWYHYGPQGETRQLTNSDIKICMTKDEVISLLGVPLQESIPCSEKYLYY